MMTRPERLLTSYKHSSMARQANTEAKVENEDDPYNEEGRKYDLDLLNPSLSCAKPSYSPRCTKGKS